MSAPTEFKLNTGTVIPSVGLGTWQAPPGHVKEAVKHALKSGYRHIDCALIYQNEDEVGQGIKESGIPRSELFITSKLWNTYHDRASESLEQSLKSLGTDYLDLYLIHWPVRLVPNETSNLLPTNPDGSRSVDREWNQQETWKQMEALHASGKVKAIGVSNWSIPYLEDLSKTWKVVPAINQVELHPYNPQHDLKKYCDDKGILLEAYCPLGSTGAPLLKDEQLIKIAEKNKVSVATICISYQVNRGVVVLPKSVTPERIADNLKVIKLDDEDMKTLDGMAASGKQQRVNTPLFGWDLGFHDWYGVGNKNAPSADAVTVKA
ncbi:putative glycerol dehydrogenase [Filobasidium floriforme]|uniref:putative glycerol dehydrogenase n=1 Tax=Filobasidium floriforme TaxID=5210 RepID=UPI001E8E9526|nr:putative glycerol dehydrogenase [Filobasidium floriforme]KAH8089810.1 putative glycerol dehydrogenase [Filobasidium floriforme]